MAILGEVVNRVEGESWGENIQERIFEPLGMGNSYTSNVDFENKVGAPGEVENIMHPAIKKNRVVSVGSWADVGAADLYAPAGGSSLRWTTWQNGLGSGSIMAFMKVSP